MKNLSQNTKNRIAISLFGFFLLCLVLSVYFRNVSAKYLTIIGISIGVIGIFFSVYLFSPSKKEKKNEECDDKEISESDQSKEDEEKDTKE